VTSLRYIGDAAAHFPESKVNRRSIIMIEGKFYMKNSTIVLLTACVVLAAGCDWGGIRGNGRIVTDQRRVSDFSEIEASGAFRIEWRGGAPALSITTDENLLPYIDSRNIDNRLRLRSRENLRPTHHINVVVSSPTRSAAKLSGASDLKVPVLTGPKFAIESSGAAEVTLDGAVNELLADMTGASDLKAKSLQARSVQISTTGAASAQVNPTETLRVAITGAGDVTYLGNPPTVEKHIRGAGSIRHKD
jgi:Putative auto-transporter adhesin, head GIN domain